MNEAVVDDTPRREAGRLYLSHSTRGTLHNCAAKFEFAKLYKHPEFRESGEPTMWAADVGTAIHEGYQHYLAYGDRDAAIWRLMKSFPYKYTESFDPQNDRGLEAALATMLKMIATPVMSGYELATVMHNGIEKPAVEVPFEIVLEGVKLHNGMPVSYIGYIDAIMYAKMYDTFRTLDIKTHRDRMKDLTPKFSFHGQQVPYGMVVEHSMHKAIDEFEVLYLASYVDLLDPDIQMLDFQKNRSDIDRWVMALILDLRKINSFMLMDIFPRSEYGCVGFNKVCHYFGICGYDDKKKLQEMILLEEEPAELPKWDPWVKFSIPIPEGMV